MDTVNYGSNPDAPPTVPTQTEGAAPDAAANPLVTLDITEAQIGDWFKEIEAAKEIRQRRETIWDILLKEYLPTVEASGTAEAAKTNGHFRNTHTKLAQIFNRTPDTHLEAKGPLKDPIGINPETGAALTAADAVIIKQAVLNEKFGPGEGCVDGTRFMDEILFDCLQWAGIGWAKIGFRAVTRPYNKPVMIPDPMATPPPVQPGSILGLQPDVALPMIPQMQLNLETGVEEPVTELIQVPVFEEFYAKRGSPRKALLPADLTTTRVDEDARWVGHEFFLTAAQAKRAFNYVSPEGKQSADDLVFKSKEDEGAAPKSDRIHFYELFLKGTEFHDECFNPLVIYQLILAEGDRAKPVVYRPSPDQTLDETGRMTPDSVVGFPMEFCHLRDFPDTVWTMADAAFTNNQIKGMNTHRVQSIKLRDSAIARYLYDETAFTSDEVTNIKNGKIGEWIAVSDGKLAQGSDKIVANMVQGAAARDDHRLALMLKQDMEETLGLGAQQVGVTDDKTRTATEVADTGNKSALRMSKDQQRAVGFYLRVVRKYDMFLQRYATTDNYVTIVGQMGAKRFAVWNNKVIAGRYAYGIKPDSQLMIDAARDRQQTLIFYEKTIADPLVNRFPILQKLAAAFGLDPAEIINDPAVIAARQLAGQDGTVPEGTEGPAVKDKGDERAHRTTGGRPNAPESGAAPNTKQIPNA